MVDLAYLAPAALNAVSVEHAEEELVVFHDLEELRALVVRRGEAASILDGREEDAGGVLAV